MAGFDWANLGTQLGAFGTQSPQELGQVPPSLVDKLLAGLVNSAGRAAMAPGNAYMSTPDNPVTTEQMVGPAADLAGLMVGTPGQPGLGASIGKPGIFKAYHGTGTAFDEFSAAAPKTTGGGLNDRGFFLSPDPRTASRYAEFGGDAPNVRMHNLDLKKPLEMSAGEFERLQDIANLHRNGKELPEVKAVFLQDDLAKAGINWDGKGHPIDAIRAAGFDSITKLPGKYGAEPEYMVFDPAQIKGTTIGSGSQDARTSALVAGTQGIRAYHGSPYDFDKFDLSKIGTGEGAQAYGHGLYFAENPAVAADYKFRLAANKNRELPRMGFYEGQNPIDVFGTGLHQLNDRFSAISGGASGNIGQKEILRAIDSEIAPLESGRFRGPLVQENLQKWQEARKFIEANPNITWRPEPFKGRMYEVNINADPQQFLDWDKPLSQQSKEVRDAYAKITGYPDPKKAELRVRETDELMKALSSDRDPITNRIKDEAGWHKLARERDAAWKEWNDAQSGQRAYDALANYSAMRQSPAWAPVPPNLNRRGAASDFLKQQGIPGIKYLDQGSRSAGTGTNNYVVFNPDIIEILRKYGIAAGIIPAAASQMTGSDQVQ